MTNPVGGPNPFGNMFGPQSPTPSSPPPGTSGKGHDPLEAYWLAHGWTKEDYQKFKKALEQFMAARIKEDMQKMDETQKKIGQKIKSGDG